MGDPRDQECCVAGCCSWRARRYKSDKEFGWHIHTLKNDEEWHRPEVFMGSRGAASGRTFVGGGEDRCLPVFGVLRGVSRSDLDKMLVLRQVMTSSISRH